MSPKLSFDLSDWSFTTQFMVQIISELMPKVALKCAAVKFDDEVNDKVLAGAGCLYTTTASLSMRFHQWNTVIASW